MWLNCNFGTKSPPQSPVYPVSPSLPPLPDGHMQGPMRQCSVVSNTDPELGLDNHGYTVTNHNTHMYRRAPTTYHRHVSTQHKSLRRLYIFVIVAFFILLLANATLLLFVPRISKEAQRAVYRCVPCDKLRLSSDPLDDHTGGLERKLEGDQEVCCAKNASQDEQILEVLIKRGVKQQAASGAFQQALPRVGGPPDRPPVVGPNASVYNTTAPPAENQHAAHLFLHYPTSNSQDDTSYSTIRTWYDPSQPGELNFVRSGMNFDPERGRFTITKSGLYQMYSHLVFRGPRIAAESHTPMLFSQIILRENPSYPDGHPQILLEDTEVVRCDEPEQSLPCYTSQIASILPLRKGDEIFIEAKPSRLLKAGGKKSFMGLYRISD